MGKRKSSRARKLMQPKKAKMEKLDTTFQCPFCGNSNSVECKIESIDNMQKGSSRALIGVADCWVCKERYCTKATNLTEPIDIYSEWLDECEKVNQKANIQMKDHQYSRILVA